MLLAHRAYFLLLEAFFFSVCLLPKKKKHLNISYSCMVFIKRKGQNQLNTHIIKVRYGYYMQT